MAAMTRHLVFLAVLLAPSAALAGKFGGFSADASRYLDGKDLVCRPIPVSADGGASGAAECDKVTDRAELKGYGFKVPKKVTKIADGRLQLSSRVEGSALVVEGRTADAKIVTLVTYEVEGGATPAVKGLWATVDGALLAIEYKAGVASAVVGFDLAAALGGALPPLGLADRLQRKGGKWDQRLVPCEQAGVVLHLQPKSKFKITIQTRCQSDRDKLTLSGTWDVVEPDQLSLTFHNQGAGEEVLECRVAECDGAACITCSSEDVSFTLAQ